MRLSEGRRIMRDAWRNAYMFGDLDVKTFVDIDLRIERGQIDADELAELLGIAAVDVSPFCDAT